MGIACLAAEVLHVFRTYLRSAEFLDCARTESRYFTRNRCMSLEDCVLFLLTKSNRSLQIGLNDFLQNRKICSKQAFSQKRRHIRQHAIWQLAELVRDTFYNHADFFTWNGYRLLAVDGTRMNLPDSPKLMSRFGAQLSSGNQVQCLLSVVYDVLNQQVISVRSECCSGSERALIDKQIREDACFTPGKEIFILDRGYPSAELIKTLNETGHLFVMRASTEFLRGFHLTSDDCIVDYTFSRKSYRAKLRVVSFGLTDGSVEYLVTNLFDTRFRIEDFSKVYHARWEVEQWFRGLKSTIESENISGLDEQTFLQDLYANFTLLNLNGVFFFASQMHFIQNPGKRKYEIKPNRRVLAVSLRERLCVLLIGMSFNYLRRKVRVFLYQTIRSVVDVRPGRSFLRKKNHLSLSFPTNQRH